MWRLSLSFATADWIKLQIAPGYSRLLMEFVIWLVWCRTGLRDPLKNMSALHIVETMLRTTYSLDITRRHGRLASYHHIKSWWLS